MVRKYRLFVGLCVLIMMLAAGQGLLIVSAQGPDAWTAYDLNMRTGPATSHAVVSMLPANSGLVLEARNADASWLLGRTEDGSHRGWVASLYLTFQAGYSAFNLPVSGEILDAPAAAPAEAPPAPDEPNPAPAATGGTAYTVYQLNVRSGPGTNHRSLGVIPGNAALVLEARNADSSWVLAHTEDGATRGWLASLYLNFVGISASSLPVSSEIISGPAAAPAVVNDNPTFDGIPTGGFDLASVENIDLAAYPVVGRSTARARSIFLEGRALGNNSHVLAKVGDCSSEHWYFLKVFPWGQYNLGTYGNLQGVINHFGESLAYDSQATHNGFNANSVMHPGWANPAYCRADESPLLCEYHLNKPSIAIIMFGTSDLLVMTPYEFDFYMRDIVDQTIEAGVIPVLSTFPGNMNFWDKTILYNKIVVRIALDYDIPLINLWLALEALPNKGLEPDGFHLGEPLDAAGNLSGANMQTGYPTRNLVTLQTLDNILNSAMR